MSNRTVWLLRAAAYLVPLSLLLSTAAAAGSWVNAHRLEVENADRREQSCEAGDESRATVRDIAKQVGLESTEAIIEVASANAEDPPDPAVLDNYRAITERRMTDIVNQLPARRWDPEAGECRDVAVTEGDP